MIIKGSEWYDLLTGSPPFTPQTGLPGSTFFVITGIHGAHVIAGLVALVYLLVRTRKGWTPGKRATVEHFGLYWAFVDMVWVFVFLLLYLICEECHGSQHDTSGRLGICCSGCYHTSRLG